MIHYSKYFPELSPSQINALERLTPLFLSWNERLNLSAIRDYEGVEIKHILDALLILPFHLIQKNALVMDLGTGGGFPGLPLAIAYPETTFVLVDARKKKIKAVSDIAKSLHLKNVQCLAGRAEELGREKKYREQCDVVLTRALGSFPVILEYGLPFVTVGGRLITYQGPGIMKDVQDYEATANLLSATIGAIRSSILPIENAQRHFIIVEKTHPISNDYPRRAGIPSKSPLA